jgi:outer membrane protein OmpA-like peptidoglycan-associated protein
MKRTLLFTALFFAVVPAYAQYYDEDVRLEERDYNRDDRFADAWNDGYVDDELTELQRQLEELRRDPRVERFAMRELALAEESIGELSQEDNIDADDLGEAADEIEAVRMAAIEGARRAGWDRDEFETAYGDDSPYDERFFERDDYAREEGSDDRANARARDARSEADRARADAEAQREAALAAQLEAEHEKNRNARLRAELGNLQSKETERGLVVTIGDVLFETGKSELKSGATRNLDKLVAAMKKAPDATVIVEGHTDSVGKHNYNVALSNRRANAVRNYLVKKGIAARRIEASGLGPDHPVATNKTAAGRQQNRRVELIFQGDEEAPQVARDE